MVGKACRSRKSASYHYVSREEVDRVMNAASQLAFSLLFIQGSSIHGMGLPIIRLNPNLEIPNRNTKRFVFMAILNPVQLTTKDLTITSPTLVHLTL